MILVTWCKKCGSSGFQLYSVHTGTKPEKLDYDVTCIWSILNRRDLIGELDTTDFVTVSAFFLCKMFFTPSILNLLKSLWGKYIFFSLKMFIALAVAFWEISVDSCENTNIILLVSPECVQVLPGSRALKTGVQSVYQTETLVGLLVITVNVAPAGNCLLDVRWWGVPGCGQEKRLMWQPQEFYGFMLSTQLW